MNALPFAAVLVWSPLTVVLVILLVLILFGSFPAYPYSRGWGYGPSGVFFVLLVILLILLLL